MLFVVVAVGSISFPFSERKLYCFVGSFDEHPPSIIWMVLYCVLLV